MQKVSTSSAPTRKKAWTIILEDDGHGFDPEEASLKRESYGLVNMKSRAASSGIHLSITSVHNEGVKVILVIDHGSITDPNGIILL